MGENLPCGCVKGYYDCKDHDIYARSPQRLAKLTPFERQYDDWIFARDRTCTCFLLAPCSFCVDKGD